VCVEGKQEGSGLDGLLFLWKDSSAIERKCKYDRKDGGA
jgi:hypothetical protein